MISAKGGWAVSHCGLDILARESRGATHERSSLTVQESRLPWIQWRSQEGKYILLVGGANRAPPAVHYPVWLVRLLRRDGDQGHLLTAGALDHGEGEHDGHAGVLGAPVAVLHLGLLVALTHGGKGVHRFLRTALDPDLIASRAVAGWRESERAAVLQVGYGQLDRCSLQHHGPAPKSKMRGGDSAG